MLSILFAILLPFVNGDGIDKSSFITRPFEFVILVDASRNVPAADFVRAVEAIRRVPDDIEIGENASRLGVVAFSDLPVVLLNLTSNAALVRSLPATHATGGTAQIHPALRFVKDTVFADARSGAQKLLFLLTSSVSDKSATENAAAELKNIGNAIAVAIVGPLINSTDVAEHFGRIVGDPSWLLKFEDYGDVKIFRPSAGATSAVMIATPGTAGSSKMIAPSAVATGRPRRAARATSTSGTQGTSPSDGKIPAKAVDPEEQEEWPPWTIGVSAVLGGLIVVVVVGFLVVVVLMKRRAKAARTKIGDLVGANAIAAPGPKSAASAGQESVYVETSASARPGIDQSLGASLVEEPRRSTMSRIAAPKKSSELAKKRESSTAKSSGSKISFQSKSKVATKSTVMGKGGRRI